MKTTFKKYLQEANMPKAESDEDLIASIKDGKFTKDGSHLSITGDFFCTHSNLTSLEGAPGYVADALRCNNNLLTSLKGAPSSVGGIFSCSNNQLTSLEGAPTSVAGRFYCTNNQLTSLKDIHKHILMIDGKFFAVGNPIKSHVLGLLKIKALREVYLDNQEVEEIINKYLPEGDIFACQQELIDAGLEEFAQL